VKPKVLKLGEVKPMDDAIGEVAFSDTGKAKGGGKTEGARWWHRQHAVVPAGSCGPTILEVGELELLEVVKGWGLEPAGLRGWSGWDTEAANRGLVRGEDAGHDTIVVRVPGCFTTGAIYFDEAAAVKVQRRGAPDVAPA
jgi:hypothetical protein